MLPNHLGVHKMRGFTLTEMVVVIAIIAIHITFGNQAVGAIKGKILSLRPAVVADAPVVPVTWVCGNASPPDKMTVKGDNRTSVPANYLPLECRLRN